MTKIVLSIALLSFSIMGCSTTQVFQNPNDFKISFSNYQFELNDHYSVSFVLCEKDAINYYNCSNGSLVTLNDNKGYYLANKGNKSIVLEKMNHINNFYLQDETPSMYQINLSNINSYEIETQNYYIFVQKD